MRECCAPPCYCSSVSAPGRRYRLPRFCHAVQNRLGFLGSGGQAASFELDLVLEPRKIRSKWDGTGQFALVLGVNRSQERSFPMPNFARSILVVGMLVFSPWVLAQDRKSTRLNSSHEWISYAVLCLKKRSRERGRAHD